MELDEAMGWEEVVEGRRSMRVACRCGTAKSTRFSQSALWRDSGAAVKNLARYGTRPWCAIHRITEHFEMVPLGTRPGVTNCVHSCLCGAGTLPPQNLSHPPSANPKHHVDAPEDVCTRCLCRHSPVPPPPGLARSRLASLQERHPTQRSGRRREFRPHHGPTCCCWQHHHPRGSLRPA